LVGQDLLLPSRFETLPYVVPSLRPFRLGEIGYLRRGEALSCSRIVIPTHTAPTGNYNESVINGLRSLLTSYYGERATLPPQERIYISRSAAARRRIVNEDSVRNVMKDYGFQVVCLEEHPLDEQIAMMSRARFVVSNHGAGLTNILFMPAGGHVLELRREGDAHNNCFFSLASALGLGYFYQVNRSGRPRMNPRSRDLIVDTRALRVNLAAMLGDESTV
jgi:hypothetical protein